MIGPTRLPRPARRRRIDQEALTQARDALQQAARYMTAKLTSADGYPSQHKTKSCAEQDSKYCEIVARVTEHPRLLTRVRLHPTAALGRALTARLLHRFLPKNGGRRFGAPGAFAP